MRAAGKCKMRNEDDYGLTKNRCINKKVCRPSALTEDTLEFACLAPCEKHETACLSAIGTATCTDISTDKHNCGACSYGGERCKSGQSCNMGICECGEGKIVCDDKCIDSLSDNEFCGAKDSCEGDDKGVACNDTEDMLKQCFRGACVGIECVDENKTRCPDPDNEGNYVCLDTKSDINHCGACGNACKPYMAKKPVACVQGACQYEGCEDGYTSCIREGEEFCVNNTSDNSYFCGAKCEVCSTGPCKDGSCTNTSCANSCETETGECVNTTELCGFACTNCLDPSANAELAECYEPSTGALKTCKYIRCKPNYYLSKDYSRCLPADAEHCAASNSTNVVNCNTRKPEGANLMQCLNGKCVPKDCLPGYTYYESHHRCVPSDCCDGVSNAKSATCTNNVCVIKECHDGYHIVRGSGNANDSCVPNSSTACGLPTSSTTADCTKIPNAQSVDCSHGRCVVKTCKGGINCDAENDFRYASDCINHACNYSCKSSVHKWCYGKCLELIGDVDCGNCPNNCKDGDICERVEIGKVVCSSPI
jgi:hypothetical protein